MLITDIEWDLLEFCVWFVDNRTALRTEELDPPGHPNIQFDVMIIRNNSRAISQKEYDANGKELPDILVPNYFDDYKTRHNLAFVFSGSRIN